MTDIVVLGSFMMDLVARSKRLPDNGETIIGNSFEKNAGGKGANQAATIAKLGKNVSFIGMVGEDDFGKLAEKTLKDSGVNVDYLLKVKNTSTGVGSVWVDESTGNNRIIIIPGANLKFSKDNLYDIQEIIKSADLIVLQLEMNLEMTFEAIEIAYQLGIPVLLNPAPATNLPDEVYKKISYLTPNETELSILSEMKTDSIDDVKNAAQYLVEKGVQNVVVTLGEKGSIWISKSGECVFSKSKKVKAVDTVAAGDSFNGALAYGIVEDWPKEKILEFANTVGALTVTKTGAIKSLPTISDVQKFCEE